MSSTVDTNVLVYASDRRSPEWQAARELLERLSLEREVLVLLWPTLLGYLRIVTNPRIFADPLPPRDALANVRSLLALPHTRALGETQGFLDHYESVARTDTRGSAVPDAHLVALMRQHRIRTIYTRDRDFRRYDGIEVRDPFA